jgi:uncharacterized protein (DUF2267 family)
MSSIEVIDTTVQKTYRWLRDLGEELHEEDTHHNYQVLRAVLHVLRDSLPVNEAADMAAQLPMLVRGLYYEGWHPAKTPLKLRSRDEFLSRIHETFPPSSMIVDPERFARAVFALLEKHLTAGELHQVRSNLPLNVQSLWPSQQRAMEAAARTGS